MNAHSVGRRELLSSMALLVPAVGLAAGASRSVVQVMLTQPDPALTSLLRSIPLQSPLRRWNSNLSNISSTEVLDLESVAYGIPGGDLTLRWIAKRVPFEVLTERSFTRPKSLLAGRGPANWNLVMPDGLTGKELQTRAARAVTKAAAGRRAFPATVLGQQFESIVACLEDAQLRGGVYTMLVPSAASLRGTDAPVDALLATFQDELYRRGLASNVLTLVASLPTGRSGAEHLCTLMGSSVKSATISESFAVTTANIEAWFSDRVGTGAYLL